MNPFKYAQMMKYLTRVKKQKPDLPDVFPASKAPIPPVREDVEEIEAVNRFIRDNPRQDMAGGGMLVQPGFGGTRQGYRDEKTTLQAATKELRELYNNDKLTKKIIELVKKEPDDYNSILKKINSYKGLSLIHI